MIAFYLIISVVFTICIMSIQLWIYVLYGKYYDMVRKENSKEYIDAFVDTPENQMFEISFFKVYPSLISDVSDVESTNKLIKRHNGLVTLYRLIIIAFPIIILLLSNIL